MSKKTLSLDLRERVVSAVAAGMSRRQAAERFGVLALRRRALIAGAPARRRLAVLRPDRVGGPLVGAHRRAFPSDHVARRRGELRHHAQGTCRTTCRARASLQHRIVVALLRPSRHYVEKRPRMRANRTRRDRASTGGGRSKTRRRQHRRVGDSLAAGCPFRTLSCRPFEVINFAKGGSRISPGSWSVRNEIARRASSSTEV